MKKTDINQAHFKAPIVSDTDKPFLDLKNIKKDTFYQSSEVFPPRGSFINIPEDILSGAQKDLLDNARAKLSLHKSLYYSCNFF